MAEGVRPGSEENDLSPPLPRRKKGVDVGIDSESCSGDMLGLDRYSSSSKFFKAEDKGPAELLLNPFGDPWRTRSRFNPFIWIMTSSSQGLVKTARPDAPSVLDGFAGPSYPETEAYNNYSSLASSPYHYDETVSRIAPQMPAFRQMRAGFGKLNLRKKFMGYTVVNFDERNLYAPGNEPPEWAYLHYPESSMRRADRVRFKDGSTLIASGEVFDIRKPEVRSLLAKALANLMTVNHVDAVLVDYAVRAYAFGIPALMDVLSSQWIEEFQEHQLTLIKTLHAELRGAGKELFLNGVMLDGIISTEPELVRMFGKHCDGLFWEQPFRYEWFNFNDNGTNYYERLDEFFDIIFAMKKKLIVKQGTYRFHATEDIQKSWTWRYAHTDHGIERHLAEYLTCFYLLYANRHRSMMLYTYPVEMSDIFASEAYFRFWDTEVGEPTHKRMELARDIHMRAYENGIVFVNNRLEPARIWDKLRPRDYKGRIPSLALAPLSGVFWPFPMKRMAFLTRRFLRPRTRLKSLLRPLGNVR